MFAFLCWVVLHSFKHGFPLDDRVVGGWHVSADVIKLISNHVHIAGKAALIFAQSSKLSPPTYLVQFKKTPRPARCVFSTPNLTHRG